MDKWKTISVDFDKTLCSDDRFGRPNTKVVDFIKEMHAERFDIIIHTSREHDGKRNYDSHAYLGSFVKNMIGPSSIESWLKKHRLSQYITTIYYDKPEALVYLDDRAVRVNEHLDFDLTKDLVYTASELLRRETKK